MQKQPVKTTTRNMGQTNTTIQINKPRNNKEDLRGETNRKAIKQSLLYPILKKEIMLPARISIFLFQGHNQNDCREERLPPKPEKQ